MEDLVNVTKPNEAAEEQHRANQIENDAKHAPDQRNADEEQPGTKNPADHTIDGALIGFHLDGSFFESDPLHADTTRSVTKAHFGRIA